MPRKKQHCPKRMKWEGGEGGGPPGRSPSQSGDQTLDTSSSSSDQSQDEEEEEGTPAPPSEEEVDDKAEVKEGSEPIREEDKAVDLKEKGEEEGQRMLAPEALIARDPSSPRGAPVASQPPSPSPSPPATSPNPLVAPQIQPIIDIRPHILPPSHHHQIPLHPAGMLGPAAAILPPSAAILSPSSAVILNPSAAILGTSPVLPARPVETAEILDFSTKGRKRSRRKEDSEDGDSEDESSEADSIEEEGGVLNLSKPTAPPVSTLDLSSPLDLSVNRRKRQRLANDDTSVPSSPVLASQAAQNLHTTTPNSMSPLASLASSIATHLLPHRRTSQGRGEQFKQPPTPWATGPNPGTNLPYPFYPAKGAQHLHNLQAQQAAPPQGSNTLRQSSPDPWNGKVKGNVTTPPGYNLATSVAPSDATKALEKMSELSKLGSDPVREDAAAMSYLRQHQAGSVSSRQSAWQSHWLSKGAEQARDVLKCVWCRQSFQSLSALTVHMKEAKHCGVQGIPPGQTPVTVAISTTQTTQPNSSSIQSTSNMSNSSSSAAASGTQQGKDLSLLIKETMPLPRKLVRGQDVWLGKGAEQTRQILKCMWCGQSFRSLAEMTSHMQQTQHYTNIVSQEQIISWKSADERSGSGSGTAANANSTSSTTSSNSSSQSGHVTAVLTCKVCDEAFGSLKELSNHMVKNAHYKEHIMRSITEGGNAGQLGNSAQRRRGGSGGGSAASVLAAREKRKKSLPVRKLLELERAQNELKNGAEGKGANLAMLTNTGGGRITCEKCGERIETALFVEHIRQCVGGNVSALTQQRNLLKSALMSEGQDAAGFPGSRPDVSPLAPPTRPSSKLPTPDKTDTKTEPTQTGSGGSGSSPSVLNAIEKLIEKSFDSRMRQGYPGGMSGASGNIAAGMQPIGSSILKRLGIDESVDYTKPLVDQHTMNLLRGYHAYGQFGGLLTSPVQAGSSGKRERSGSESSSVSDRCGGGSVTPPDRRQKSLTPRSTPEAIQSSPVATPVANLTNSTPPTSQPATPMPEKKEEEEHEAGEEEKEEKEDVDKDECKKEEKVVEDGVSEEPKEVDEESQEKPSKDETEEEAEESPKGEEKPKVEKEAVEETGKEDLKKEDDPDKEEEAPKESPKTAGSLGALSSMFDSLSGEPASSGSSAVASSAGGTTSHPLAALQKLCDKTESHHNHGTSHQTHTRSPSVGSTSSTLNANYPSSSNTSPSNPGAILAFSWACNDAVVSDSLLKCAFCETPFVSKGAYRHHLSKMHFVKDGVLPDGPQAGGSSQEGASQGRSDVVSPKSSQASNANEGRSPQVSTTPPGTSSADESPHSKFLKYTELAKQLSSKYV